MDPSTQYQRFAEEFRRLAQQAKTEQHQRILEEMARAWEKLAKETDLEDSYSQPLSECFLASCACAKRNHTCAICNKEARDFASWTAFAMSKHSLA